MLELWLHNIYCYCCVVVMPKCEASKQNVEAKSGFETKMREKHRATTEYCKETQGF